MTLPNSQAMSGTSRTTDPRYRSGGTGCECIGWNFGDDAYANQSVAK